MKDYSQDDGWVTYVPEYDGNRDDTDPVTVEVKPLTVREARNAMKNLSAERVKGFRNRFKTNQAEVSEKTFVRHVRNITNLRMNGKPVTTAEELLDTELIDLVDEIEAAISDISILSGGEVKNFRPQSGGSADRADGTATSAPTNSDG